MERSDLEWFLHHLDLDIHDRELESGGYSLDFYWDAFDVTKAILGTAAYYAPDGSFETEQFGKDIALVRCLTGVGWFGKMRLLQPHQAEFLRLIDSDFAHTPITVSTEEMQQFVKDSRLRSSLEFDPESLIESPDKVSKIVQEQAGNAPTLFKVVYCLELTWKARLASWVRSNWLKLDDQVLDYSAVVGSDDFQRLKASLEKERPLWPTSNFADAMAICLLAARVRDFRIGKARRVPRFFASTRVYLRVLRNTGLTHLLEYEHGDQTFSVLRDADYYKLRASFRPPQAQLQAAKQYADEFIASLHDARSRVAEILDAQKPLTPEVIDAVQVGGKPLEEVIRSLKQFWFLETVWLPFGATAKVKEVIGGLTKTARQLRESPQFREGIEREIKNTKEALKANSREYQWLSRLWKDVGDAIHTVSSSLRAVGESDLELFKTTGLLRFGFPEECHQDIETLLRKLINDHRHAQIEAHSEVVRKCQEARSQIGGVSNEVVAAAVLWVLRMDGQLVDLLSKSDRLGHYSLRIVVAAAYFRLRRPSGVSEAWHLIKGLERECEGVRADGKRLDLVVGLGYLYFHYWLYKVQSSVGLDSSESRSLTNAAISYARTGYFEVEAGDLQKRVFALNQYLYYMVRGADEIDWAKANDAADKLLSFLDNPVVWQYRFDDTLAYYWEARAALTKTRRRECLEQADFYLERAWAHANGDDEVVKHRGRMQIVMGDLEI